MFGIRTLITVLTYHPLFYVACPGGEVHPDLEEPARVSGERKCILPVLDLLKGLSGLSVRKNVRRTQTALRDAEYTLASTRKGIVKEYLQAGIDARTAYGKYLGAQEQVRSAEEAARQITAKYECIFKQKILGMYRNFDRSIMPRRTYCSGGRDSDSP